MTEDAIATARSKLTTKLAELRRRELHAIETLAPLRHLANPWLHLGIAAFIGYRLGRPHRAPPPIAAPPADSMTRTIVRAGVIAAAEAIVRRVAVLLVTPVAATEPAQ
jgi:hypothetical protein